MVAVQVSEKEARASLRGLEGRVALAAVNGPTAVVLSGDEDATRQLAESWAAAGAQDEAAAGLARVSLAADGRAAEQFAEVARGLPFAQPRIPVVSNVTGEPVTSEWDSPEYWVRHARETVRFADGVRWLYAQGVRCFLELGPDGVLSAMSRDCLAGGERPWRDEAKVPGGGEGGAAAEAAEDGHGPAAQEDAVVALALLRGERPEARTFLGALGEAWAHGAEVDWAAAAPRGGRAAGGAADVRVAAQALLAGTHGGPRAQRGGRSRGRLVLPGRLAAGGRPLGGGAGGRVAGSRTGGDGGRGRVRGGGARAPRCAGRAGGGRVRRRGEPGAVGAAAARSAGRQKRPSRRARVWRRREGSVSGVRAGGVLSLLAWDERAQGVVGAVPAGLAATVALVQGLADAGVEGRLWLATRGAVAVGAGDRVESPSQAAVWGLGRTLALEQPQRWGGLVDLPQTLDERALEGLCAALGGVGEEDQLAVREAGVFARRLARAPAGGSGNGAAVRRGGGVPGAGVAAGPGGVAGAGVAAGPGGVAGAGVAAGPGGVADAAGAGAAAGPGGGLADAAGDGSAAEPRGAVWRPRGTVLVTGGTGGLGACVARWLAGAGAEHLLLASRRGPAAPGAAELVAELEGRGVGVSVVACDVADRAQVRELLAHVPAEHPLDAVVHAAGVGSPCARRRAHGASSARRPSRPRSAGRGTCTS